MSAEPLSDDPLPSALTAPAVCTILVTGGPMPDLRTGRSVLIDGKELLLPRDSTVSVEVSHDDAMRVTLSFVADVEFRRVPFYILRDEDGVPISYPLSMSDPQAKDVN